MSELIQNNQTKCYTFNVIGDNRGSLIAIEANKDIPFDIKRVYYIFNTQQGVARGKHAHTRLQQVLICTSGNCKILLDDGQSKEVIELNSPAKGLYIGQKIWREMYDFSDDCVLMVLASEHYDEAEYIRDYSEFLEGAKR